MLFPIVMKIVCLHCDSNGSVIEFLISVFSLTRCILRDLDTDLPTGVISKVIENLEFMLYQFEIEFSLP